MAMGAFHNGLDGLVKQIESYPNLDNWKKELDLQHGLRPAREGWRVKAMPVGHKARRTKEG